jgi:hypothetical protein
VWRKIEWAKKHTDDLESEIIAFRDTSPYEFEIQGNPKTGPGSYRIKGTPQPLPESIPLILGDAAHNLRVALDHFACAVVVTVTDRTAFPVWRASRTPTSVQWSGLVKGKLNGAAPRLIKAVTAVKAYKTGNGEYVWAVDELDRIDKHRLLLSVAAANTGVTLDAAEMFRNVTLAAGLTDVPSLFITIKPADWTPIEEGTELFVVPGPGGFDADPQFPFDVTLGEPDVLRGEPVVPALRRLIDEVEGLLKRLVPLV